MSFGFTDDRFNKDEKKVKYNLDDAIKYQDWNNIKSGLKIQSILTGSLWIITKTDRNSKLVYIKWANGKTSRAYQKDLENAVLVK